MRKKGVNKVVQSTEEVNDKFKALGKAHQKSQCDIRGWETFLVVRFFICPLFREPEKIPYIQTTAEKKGYVTSHKMWPP